MSSLPPTRSIFVNKLPSATRIAVTEEGRLTRFEVLKQRELMLLGQVYLGRVSKVLPSIDACFVEVGGKATVFVNRRQLPQAWFPSNQTKLSDVVKPGRVLRLQITKLPSQRKQAQGSGKLKLGGFYLVLEEEGQGIRFSGHFTGDRQVMVDSLEAKGSLGLGWRVRSAAGSAVPAHVLQEADALLELYRELAALPLEGSSRLVHQPVFLDPILADEDPNHLRAIYFDNEQLWQQARDFYRHRAPYLLPKLERHDLEIPLFDTYKLNSAIEALLSPKVWLKSGGALHFRQTEAMVTIDVDSGKQMKARGAASAALRTNLEAVHELFHQIRVRNLAGLIAVDFLNLSSAGERKQLERAIAVEAAKDRCEIDLEPINRFGVVMMARQRRGEDIERRLQAGCSHCGGSGRVLSAETAVLNLQQILLRDGRRYAGEQLEIQVGPLLHGQMKRDRWLKSLADQFGFSWQLELQPSWPGSRFQVNLKDQVDESGSD